MAEQRRVRVCAALESRGVDRTRSMAHGSVRVRLALPLPRRSRVVAPRYGPGVRAREGDRRRSHDGRRLSHLRARTDAGLEALGVVRGSGRGIDPGARLLVNVAPRAARVSRGRHCVSTSSHRHSSRAGPRGSQPRPSPAWRRRSCDCSSSPSSQARSPPPRSSGSQVRAGTDFAATGACGTGPASSSSRSAPPSCSTCSSRTTATSGRSRRRAAAAGCSSTACGRRVR